MYCTILGKRENKYIVRSNFYQHHCRTDPPSTLLPGRTA